MTRTDLSMATTDVPGPRWRRPTVSVWITVICWLVGVAVLLYPTTAAWLTQSNQSAVIERYNSELKDVQPDVATQVRQAQQYNEALSSGALLAAGANVAVGAGESRDARLKYDEQLVSPSGVMARLSIPAIDLDLPIYHGTDEETLLKGLGHLEGTSLPVGGDSTRSVITGHRGLASARMFTDLDRVEKGDEFTLDSFGQTLSYRVTEIKVVKPEDTETLHQVAGKDLVTLITCTPLGINSHRILVTGERITPTPQHDLDQAGMSPELPGFPWWVLAFVSAVLLAVLYLWWTGRSRWKSAQHAVRL